MSTFSRAAFSHRRLLFVVGLEEGRVFPSAFEDPILLDAERARISPSLRLSGDRIDESVYRALACLAVGVGPARRRDLPELLVPRPARVPRDLRVVAHAAGLPRHVRPAGRDI